MSPLEKAVRAHWIAYRVTHGASQERAEAFWDRMSAELPSEVAGLTQALRAALAALMEPTSEMADAGREAIEAWHGEGDEGLHLTEPEYCWQAMLTKVIE